GSQFSKHSSISDSSQLTFLGCPSSSSYDVYVEEACEVVLAASGQEVVSDSYYLDTETAALQNEDLRLLLELSSSQFGTYKNNHNMRFRPRPGYLEKHPEITNSMRVILVDWLVEVVQEYKLRSETLHLAINYLDRFLSCTAYVKRDKLQLVGTAALLIAAKYEEIFPPELSEFVYTTDSTYTKKQLLRMEHVFLKVLAFRMAAPTTNQFLHLFMSIHSVCANTENLARFHKNKSLKSVCKMSLCLRSLLFSESSLLLGMAEPAELLLIKDQYELAFDSLSRGLDCEEAGKRAEALEYYKKGRQHLTQGVEVPTGGERQRGLSWDLARQLQQRMRDTLRTVTTHLSELETSQLTTGHQRGRLLMDLTPSLYPDLALNSQRLNSSLHHLYPTVPAATQSTTPKLPPHRPLSPAAPHTVPAAAPGPTAMANPGDQPPAYTPQPSVGHRSLSYSPAGGGLLRSGRQTGADGSELLFIPSGVQMFFVAPNGQVSSLSYPGYLRIVAFGNQQKDSTPGRPSAFLYVCDWLYPLTADTPVLLANSGIFMFPNPLAETPGSYVGIVLSSKLPAANREMFQDVLLQLTDLRVQDPEGAGSEVINLSEKIPLSPPKDETGLTMSTGEKDKPPLPGWSEKMAQGILSGASKLSQEFVKGAEATGRAIHKGAAKIREHITPEETPSEVSPRVTKGLQVTKQATGGAVRVSQFLVNGVSTVAGHVAEKLAPHVKKAGAKLVPESMKKSKDGRASNLDGAKFVAVSSVQGPQQHIGNFRIKHKVIRSHECCCLLSFSFSTVWSSLEAGAKLVGKSVAAETVTTVTYKYGNDAGQATDTALKSVIDVGVTAYNIDNLGIKAILKSTGKKTTKAVVKEPDGQTADTNGEEAQKLEVQKQEAQKKEEEKKK
ncbi:hypothetical protein L3Q82_022314, partial [Scortum barcoo]